MWRSDPRTVNGGGGDRLNPRGDFLLAYWLGRAMQDGPGVDVNLSRWRDRGRLSPTAA